MLLIGPLNITDRYPNKKAAMSNPNKIVKK